MISSGFRLSHWLLWASCLLLSLPHTCEAAHFSVSTVPQLQQALGQASAGDQLSLAPGVYRTQLRIDKPLTLTGPASAIIDAGGQGSAIVVASDDVRIDGLTIRNWGADLYQLDAGIRGREVSRIQVVNAQLKGPGFGIRFDKGEGFELLGNRIEGDRSSRVIERGDGIYLKGTGPARITNNRLVGGRDGVYVESCSGVDIDDNRMSEQQYPVHYMYAKDSGASGNDSWDVVGGYAIMGSQRIKVIGNRVRDAIEFGVLLNITNDSVVRHNYVSGVSNPRAAEVFDGEGKGVFIYGARDNEISSNHFQSSQIGISMAMGGEGNLIYDNLFIHNTVQVKYVGEHVLDWSHRGVGNFWSSYSGWDLDGDGIGDQSYRPNDALDRLFWIYPEGRFLMDSPVVSVLRWLEQQFQTADSAGISDHRPKMVPQWQWQPQRSASWSNER
ncbi:nitrous oxide reductase family maturation protein NosD [Ferrimonas kyonanensis]|uniref:nitrous oxide reductase family maturation protein NosD n=1 Tax=Ferrimonas kyonanensis TaxID=364763 RepID=UPI000688655B|nr:nitrous oxide reductase family maturation protein NosD [Ferrimonas kyonanensis]